MGPLYGIVPSGLGIIFCRRVLMKSNGRLRGRGGGKAPQRGSVRGACSGLFGLLVVRHLHGQGEGVCPRPPLRPSERRDSPGGVGRGRSHERPSHLKAEAIRPATVAEPSTATVPPFWKPAPSIISLTCRPRHNAPPQQQAQTMRRDTPVGLGLWLLARVASHFQHAVCWRRSGWLSRERCRCSASSVPCLTLAHPLGGPLQPVRVCAAAGRFCAPGRWRRACPCSATWRAQWWAPRRGTGPTRRPRGRCCAARGSRGAASQRSMVARPAAGGHAGMRGRHAAQETEEGAGRRTQAAWALAAAGGEESVPQCRAAGSVLR
jgi:hypothetical protein